MPEKRRILVVFEDDPIGSDQLQSQKRQRKIAVSGNRLHFSNSSKVTYLQVSIDANATNKELAIEVANILQQPSVALEISGGFELRDQE
jgi:alpha-L-arabinofuranosidase